MLTFLRRVRFVARALGRRVQALVVRWSLALLYYAGMGPVHLWMRVFHRPLLNPEARAAGWVPVAEDEFDESESLRQS